MTICNALMSWSGGKDSAMALHNIINNSSVHVCGLVSTFNKNYGRLSMHGVKESLIELQAASIGLPLYKMYVSKPENDEYEEQTIKLYTRLKKEQNITHVIFGDIFLEDLRSYRESLFAKIGMQCLFPLWGSNTKHLVKYFIENKFSSVVCCVSDAVLSEEHVGKVIDEKYIANLPLTVDPCGENGEYHSFCFDGPLFKKRILIEVKEKVYKPLSNAHENTNVKGFWYCELDAVSD